MTTARIAKVLDDLDALRWEIASKDKQRAVLIERRDRLIRKALQLGVTERTIGTAAGISGVAVHKKR